jgi:hypothetical protein
MKAQLVPLLSGPNVVLVRQLSHRRKAANAGRNSLESHYIFDIPNGALTDLFDMFSGHLLRALKTIQQSS